MGLREKTAISRKNQKPESRLRKNHYQSARRCGHLKQLEIHNNYIFVFRIGVLRLNFSFFPRKSNKFSVFCNILIFFDIIYRILLKRDEGTINIIDSFL